jgi:membrane-bound metal-dependent hydrolase YbcI (DUF457 family)
VPSSIAHAAVAVIANPLLDRNDRSLGLLWPAAGFAAAPDLDAVPVILGRGMPFAHRGVTHSLAAALIAAAVIVTLRHKNQPLRSLPRAYLYFAVVIASHGLLDCLTTYGEGVGLLALDIGRFRRTV